MTVTQPLLRGFGPALNRRFIRIAGNERKIASLLFQQQLIATVYGVVRLYTDFVALYEDEKVKQETVALAEKLLLRHQGAGGRGHAGAGGDDARQRPGLLHAPGPDQRARPARGAGGHPQDRADRAGNEDPEVRAAHIIPTDTLTIPEKDEIRPIQDLIAEALANRPDLGQARLQIENSQIGLEGAAQRHAA